MDHMMRPKATVLPESAIVPPTCLIQPPPNRFTHEVTSEQPYYYAASTPISAPDGTFPAGTKVLLLFHDGGSLCYVADARGLYVAIPFKGLRPIE